MSPREATAYWVVAPAHGELRREPLPDPLPPGHSLVATEVSGISVGTERLVGCGRVPASCADVMACPGMAGSFDLPVKYGYSLVGTAIAGALTGKRVFGMHPHQDFAVLDDARALVLPDDLPSSRAALIPNTETALNAVWDAELTPADRAIVFGAGAVGLLVAWAAARTVGCELAVVELDAERAARAAALPFVSRVLPLEELQPGAFTVAFHTTGSSLGLQCGLEAVGFEGRVVELSWYGDRAVEVALGTHFHYQRKRILASQVAHIAPSQRAHIDHRQRLDRVLALLAERDVDRLLGGPVPFAELPRFMAELYAGNPSDPAPWIAYPSS